MERIPVVTIEDRIEVTEEFKDYFDKFIPFEEKIKRTVWQKITKKGIRDKKILTPMVMKEFSVSKRTANSVVIDIKGRFNALKEFTREQIKSLKLKVTKIKKKIKSLKNRLKRLLC